MELNKLTKITTRGAKRVGRGTGSGKGKTSGRGTKGQKARGKVRLGFIGGTLPLYKRLPYNRGFGNTVLGEKVVNVSLSQLAVFKAGSEVDLQSLVEQKIISERDARRGIKILGNGEINAALTVKLPVSAAAAAKIEKAGGKVLRV